MDKTKLKLNIAFIIFFSFSLSDKLIKWRKGVQIQERLLWANINWIEEGNLLSPFLSLNFKVEKVGIKDLELKLILYFFFSKLAPLISNGLSTSVIFLPPGNR